MRRLALSLLAVTLMLTAGVAVAQDRGGQDNGRQRGPGGQFDPEQMRQRMMEGLKERMGATDEEWQVIEPKLAKVVETQRETRMGGFGGRGGFGGGRGGREGADENPSPIAQAASDLRTTLEDESASADAIKEKLQALRDARAKAQAELKAAQEDLQGVLTQRQEAMLVMAGMLE